LAARSDVFKAMFYGPVKETGVITVTDCEPEAFQALLRYLYRDSLDFPDTLVLPLLYLAKKYMIQPLHNHCLDQAYKLMLADFFKVLHYALEWDEKPLLVMCSIVLSVSAQRLIKSPEFLRCTRSTLEFIVKADKLDLENEIQLFDAVCRWSKANYKKSSGKPSAPEKRRQMLGEILFHIRYTQMTAEEIGTVVRNSNLLMDDEIFSVLMAKFNKKSDLLPITLQHLDGIGKRTKMVAENELVLNIDNIIRLTLKPHTDIAFGSVTLKTKEVEDSSMCKRTLERNIPVSVIITHLKSGRQWVMSEGNDILFENLYQKGKKRNKTTERDGLSYQTVMQMKAGEVYTLFVEDEAARGTQCYMEVEVPEEEQQWNQWDLGHQQMCDVKFTEMKFACVCGKCETSNSVNCCCSKPVPVVIGILEFYVEVPLS